MFRSPHAITSFEIIQRVLDRFLYNDKTPIIDSTIIDTSRTIKISLREQKFVSIIIRAIYN